MLYRCLVALLLAAAAIEPAAAEDDPVPSAPAAAPATPGADSATPNEPKQTEEPSAPAAAVSAPAADGAGTASAPPSPSIPAEAASPGDAPTAAPATARTETAATATPAAGEAGALDAAPAEADPLTPPPDDTSPTRAPGAPERPVAPRTVTEVDPFVAALRARLAAWPESRAKSDQEDLAALKDFYGESDAARVWTTPGGLSPRAEAAVRALGRADEWGLEAAAFELPPRPGADAQAEALVDTEIRVGLEVLKYARYARGGRVDPGAISRMIDMRPRLYEPRSIIEAIAAAPAADAYLEGLHPKHAGFLALKSALAKLRAGQATDAATKPGEKEKRTVSSTERRIVVNMERWRWLPDDLGEFYVWDNIPEQITRVFHDGKAVHRAKIVVGKPSTPTPIFSMPMRFVIFHPTWGVPDGIKSNELAPMLRRAQANSSYGWFFSDNNGASRVLQRHQLRVYAGGREINPDSVNWSSTDIRRYSFVQPASRSNVLGVVKFRFPNKHDVYMHDTSERHLFSRTSRAFSHGCMRVEDPLKFAEVILAYDKGWSRSRIDQIVSRGATHDVTLEKKVNVHLTYFTAVAETDGKLHSFGDIYGLDSRVASALAGRSVVLSSAHADDGVAAARPSSSRARTPSRRSTRRQASTASPPTAPLSWRPFGVNGGN